MRDAAMETLLGVAKPGKVTMITGRPGAGVSRTLFQAATHWAKAGRPAALASWERPASGLRAQLTTDHVEVFDILGWSMDEFGTRVQAAALPAGTLIAVDYLQLIGGTGDHSRRLAEIAQQSGITMLLGAMAPRTVHPVLAGRVPPAAVLRSFIGAIGAMRGANTRSIHRLVAIVEGDRPGLVISQPAPNLRMVHTTVWLH